MLKENLVVFLTILLLGNGLHLQNNEASIDLPAGTINLIADNGQAIKLCRNCGKAAYTDSASVSNFSPQDNDQVWTLQVVGDQVAFKGSNGNYLSRCNNCWNSAEYPDSVFVYIPDYQSKSLWTPIRLENGKYSFKSDNGKYLARCNSCASRTITANFAFVHLADPQHPWAQWQVVYTNLPRPGLYTIQADNGQFLKVCSSCGGTYPNAASIQSGRGPEYVWKVKRVGTKVTIKGSNMNYLSRCHSCWTGGSYPDSAFVHVTDSTEPFTQWAAVRQPDGKWAFQADTGKYLGRCNDCARSSSRNLAFVQAINPSSQDWATWTLTPA